MTTRIYAVYFSLIFVVSSQIAHAQHDDWCACGKHAVVPIPFSVEHGRSVWQTEAAEAFRRWNHYADVFRPFTGDGWVGGNGINEIIFSSSIQTVQVYGFALESNTLGVTLITPPPAAGNPEFDACPPPPGTTCGHFRETDVILNLDFFNGWTTDKPNLVDEPDSTNTDPAYYLATTIHELGHALGLAHNFDSLTTMNYYEDFAGQYLTRSDSEAARGHYPSQARSVTDMAAFPFRFSGFKDSGTTVASISPAEVSPGDQVRIKNFTLENIGSSPLSDVELKIYLSSDSNITASDYLLGTLSFASFSTWWDDKGTGRVFTVPTDIPAGSYSVGAIVTHGNGTQDGISYNNSWVLDAGRRLTIVDSGDPGPGIPKSSCSQGAKLWIHKSYIGYYARCGEFGGFEYWCGRLGDEEGELGSIIAAFGTSKEYTDRFSGLSDRQLIDNLYRNMFNRGAEPGPTGIGFYLELLESRRQEWRDAHGGSNEGATEYALSRIALDILNGAQGTDLVTLNGKMNACPQY